MKRQAAGQWKWICLVACCLCLASVSAADVGEKPVVIIVTGAPGEAEFDEQFQTWAAKCEAVATNANATLIRIGAKTDSTQNTDRDELRAALEAEKGGNSELWLILLGHGTFDGKAAKFNLRGPDFAATELAEWLKPVQRPVAVINTASASAPFINALSGTNRVIITATRSGHEQNFARFGGYFSEALGRLSADLDKDDQVSLLEAFLMASRETAQFYEVERRMATEHALIDDNGDGLGTSANFFKGVRAVKRPQENAALDGIRAHQWHLIRSPTEREMPPEVRRRRDELELQIAALRNKKEQLDETDYYQRLEKLLREMALVYEGAQNRGREPKVEGREPGPEQKKKGT